MRVVTIGDATLYLGDCREVLPELAAVGAMVTDPPYGMSFQSNYRGAKHKRIANDGSADLARSVLEWGGGGNVSHSMYAFGRWDNMLDYPKPKSLVTWVKNNWSMGDLQHEHARMSEVIFFYPGPDHDFPGPRPVDVVQHPRTANTFHPTEKPVGLCREIIKWTRGVVFDPFMGSGTVGVAAIQLGRAFIGVEIDEEHFDTSCRRIEEVVHSRSLLSFTAEPPRAQQATLLGLA